MAIYAMVECTMTTNIYTKNLMPGCPRICKEHKRRTTCGFGYRRDENSGNQQRGVPSCQNQERYHYRNKSPGQSQKL